MGVSMKYYSYFLVILYSTIILVSCYKSSGEQRDLSSRQSSMATPVPAPSPPPTAKPSPTVAPTSTPAPTGGLTGSAALDEEEWAFITLINDYRALNGLTKLQVSVSLTQAADWLSTDMATKNYFSHTDSANRTFGSRLNAFGYSGGYRAENIAAGNSTAQATFTQWKNSSGHNTNMLGANYRVIGIGRAYYSSSSYKWYWTTDFGSTVDETVD